jgi:IS1 family transposase
MHNIGMNRLDVETRARILAALVEGNSIRATCRMVGVDKKTVLRLLADVGDACGAFLDDTMRGLHCKRIQADEIWSFCSAKHRNVPFEKREDPNYGSMWTWVALDPDTKLVVSYMLGKRDPFCARVFIRDLSERLANRIQLTTDGLSMDVGAVENAFADQIDYAMLIKVYGREGEDGNPETRYSPAEVTSTRAVIVMGDPDESYVSTSHIERQNLTMRMGMRRFTRLTNAFSRKAMNLDRALALHFVYYNFARKHGSIKTTPAIKAGIADHVWTLREIAQLADDVRLPDAA